MYWNEILATAIHGYIVDEDCEPWFGHTMYAILCYIINDIFTT